MKYTVMLKIEMETGTPGEVRNGLIREAYSCLCQAYAESILNGCCCPPIKLSGMTFSPRSMTAIAQRCDYEGREPSLADAVSAHPELIDAAVAVSWPGIEAQMSEMNSRYAGGGAK